MVKRKTYTAPILKYLATLKHEETCLNNVGNPISWIVYWLFFFAADLLLLPDCQVARTKLGKKALAQRKFTSRISVALYCTSDVQIPCLDPRSLIPRPALKLQHATMGQKALKFPGSPSRKEYSALPIDSSWWKWVAPDSDRFIHIHSFRNFERSQF